MSIYYLLIYYIVSNVHFNGGDKRVRTADLRSASATLSQLSHIPMRLVRLSGLEPPTSRLSGVCSNQLSYKRISDNVKNIINRIEKELLLRKEVIHPHVPVRIPCYDFTPIANHTLGASQDPRTYSPQHS